MKRVFSLLPVLLCWVMTARAADEFVSFTSCSDAVRITQASIVYGESEYEGDRKSVV